MNCDKIRLGQFNTANSIWTTYLPCKIFIDENEAFLDPFCGKNDILNAVQKINPCAKTIGLDIDKSLNAIYNDSLKEIPYRYKDYAIITNPPYLAKNSATRKKLDIPYFAESNHDDLYKIALDKCLQNNDKVLAIVPETAIHNYPTKWMKEIIITCDKLFEDTECPVCIIIFDKEYARHNRPIEIWNKSTYLGTFYDILIRPIEKLSAPKAKYEIKFNDPNGELALIAIDSANGIDKIRFLKSKELQYSAPILNTSRAITKISLNNANVQIETLIERCNITLQKLRKESNDLILSSFKGNDKFGIRRRRLDFALARKIIECNYD